MENIINEIKNLEELKEKYQNQLQKTAWILQPFITWGKIVIIERYDMLLVTVPGVSRSAVRIDHFISHVKTFNEMSVRNFLKLATF